MKRQWPCQYISLESSKQTEKLYFRNITTEYYNTLWYYWLAKPTCRDGSTGIALFSFFEEWPPFCHWPWASAAWKLDRCMSLTDVQGKIPRLPRFVDMLTKSCGYLATFKLSACFGACNTFVAILSESFSFHFCFGNLTLDSTHWHSHTHRFRLPRSMWMSRASSSSTTFIYWICGHGHFHFPAFVIIQGYDYDTHKTTNKKLNLSGMELSLDMNWY